MVGPNANGVLKFFNDAKSFGFLVDEKSGEDIFFHFEDVRDSKLSKDFLKDSKNKYLVKFSYTIQQYKGKYDDSKKAVNVELIGLVDLKFVPQRC